MSSASSDSGLGLEVTEAEAEQGPEETDKRVITPDDVAVRELLNFDEVRSEERGVRMMFNESHSRKKRTATVTALMMVETV